MFFEILVVVDGYIYLDFLLLPESSVSKNRYHKIYHNPIGDSVE